MDNFDIEYKPFHDLWITENGECIKLATLTEIDTNTLEVIENALEESVKIEVLPTEPNPKVGIGLLSLKPEENDYKITNKHKFYENDALASLNEFVMNHFKKNKILN